VKKLRVLVLVREGLEPPDSIENIPDEKYKNAFWKCEFDVTATLEGLGHQVQVLGVYDSLEILHDTLNTFKPHVTFNLLEEWNSVASYDQNVVAYLELLGFKYTGCNPRGLMLARDKALSKKLLAFHNIRVPEFQVFRRGGPIKRRRSLAFPLFVKSATEDASLGISQASLVHNDRALAKRVGFVHQNTASDAIAEQFIEGREIYVAVVGNQRPQSFVPWELIFTEKPASRPMIATRQAKWDPKYQKKWGVVSRAAKDLPGDLAATIGPLSKQIYQHLGQSGYSRIDYRLTPAGDLYFLEANPNPQLSYGEDFAESVEAGGLNYEDLMQKILNLGRNSRPKGE
jgi:D-alanine-D-alanine ligase